MDGRFEPACNFTLTDMAVGSDSPDKQFHATGALDFSLKLLALLHQIFSISVQQVLKRQWHGQGIRSKKMRVESRG